MKQYDDALNHFNILINFLENEEVDFKNKEEYLGMVYLWAGLIYSEKNDVNESKKHLKKATILKKSGVSNRLTMKLRCNRIIFFFPIISITCWNSTYKI